MELRDGDLTLTLSSCGAAVTRLCFCGLPIAERGSIQGRFANRIAGGQLSIDGQSHRLLTNEKGNTLHGGPDGFSAREWTLTQVDEAAALCRLTSPDGDQGFPGTVTAEVHYTLRKNALHIAYRAVTDKPTAVSLTNHAYFNLNGLEGGRLHGGHRLTVAAAQVLEANGDLIPTGALLPVAGSRFDFRQPRRFSGSFDVCYLLSGAAPAALLRGEDSGICMEAYTDCPGLQLYNTADRICLEAQALPDAVHHAHFPSALLRPGELYARETVYRFVKP